MGEHGTPVTGTLEKHMMASSSFRQRRFMQEKCKEEWQTTFHCQRPNLSKMESFPSGSWLKDAVLSAKCFYYSFVGQ